MSACAGRALRFNRIAIRDYAAVKVAAVGAWGDREIVKEQMGVPLHPPPELNFMGILMYLRVS